MKVAIRTKTFEERYPYPWVADENFRAARDITDAMLFDTLDDAMNIFKGKKRGISGFIFVGVDFDLCGKQNGEKMIANKIHCPKCGKLFFSSVTACDIEKRLSRVSDACPNCNPEAMPQKEEGQMYVVRNKLDKNIFINCDGNYSEGEGPDVILPNLSCADMLRSLGPNPEAWEVVEVTLIDKNPGEDGWYSVRDMEFAFNGGKILCAVMMNFGVERTFDEWLAEWLQVGGFPHRAKSEPKKKSLEQDIVAILNILPRRVVNSLKKKGIEDGD